MALSKVALARYNLPSFDLKTFTYFAGSKSLLIEQRRAWPHPQAPTVYHNYKRQFQWLTETQTTQNSAIQYQQIFAFVNGKRVPSEGLYLDMDHANPSVMGYMTLFEGCGINHSNSRLQITHGMQINS